MFSWLLASKATVYTLISRDTRAGKVIEDKMCVSVLCVLILTLTCELRRGLKVLISHPLFSGSSQ